MRFIGPLIEEDLFHANHTKNEHIKQLQELYHIVLILYFN